MVRFWATDGPPAKLDADPAVSGGRERRQLTWRWQPTQRGQHREASTMAAAAPARGPSGPSAVRTF